VSQEPEFVIDGARFDDLEGFYDEVSRELMGGTAPRYDPDDPKTWDALQDKRYWGRNLDAFNDILVGAMGRVPHDGRFTLRWRSHARSQQKLGHQETARHLSASLSRAHPSNHAEIQRRLADAREGQGTTLYDTLLEIIRGHEDVRLILD
jgi:RNAse (barnase) inhibitor barstar